MDNVAAGNALGDAEQAQPRAWLESFKQERTRLAQRVTDLDEAISALESRPDLAAIITIIQRLKRY